MRRSCFGVQRNEMGIFVGTALHYYVNDSDLGDRNILHGEIRQELPSRAW